MACRVRLLLAVRDVAHVRLQAATVGAAIYYGGAALTPEKQHEFSKKQLVMLGEFHVPSSADDR